MYVYNVSYVYICMYVSISIIDLVNGTEVKWEMNQYICIYVLFCFSILSLSPATNLVDPASCHMLVSRIKPCKCQSTCIFICRGVCVRLIKRFIVYPTKGGLVPFRRDNCAKCAANTWK